MTKIFFLRITLLLSGLFLSSCGTFKKQDDAKIENSQNQESEIVESLNSDIIEFNPSVYHATRTLFVDLIHTKLHVDFDWFNSRMNGLAILTMKPHFYETDSVVLDAKGMDIHFVKLNGKELPFAYDSLQLRIKLGSVFTKLDTFNLEIAYVAKPDERALGGSDAIESDKGLYFINPRGEEPNKMPQIWTQGETESNSVWFPTIDSPNAKSTQEIFITVDNKYTTLSNGKLISSKQNETGSRTDHWKQDLQHAPYLFMMGIGEFKVVHDTYTRPDGTKMDVDYYVEPEWEPYAKSIFGETPEMIAFFSKLLGVEYPWDKYSQIVVRDYVSGAMENTGAVIFGDYVYQTDRELLDENNQATIAHELFHHWFGDLVTAESWSNLTLNESFADYSQYLWDEYHYGIDEADYQAEIEMEDYIESGNSQGYHDLVWFEYEDKEEMFDSHSYNKGGRILHMLRNYLGDEAFFAGIQNYLKTNQFKAAEFHQLRLAFEDVCGEDLNWFFNQWYLDQGHPILSVSHGLSEKENHLNLIVEQNQDLSLFPIFKLPVTVAVYDTKGVHLHKIVIDEKYEEIILPYEGELFNVVFDHQQMLLSELVERKPAAYYVHQFLNDKRYKARKMALLELNNMDETSRKLIFEAGLKDAHWFIRLLTLEKILELDQAKEYLTQIQSMFSTDKNSDVRFECVDIISKSLDKEKAEAFLMEVLSEEQSYYVLAGAIRNLGKLNPAQAMLVAKEHENEKNIQVLLAVGNIYSLHGSEAEFSFFKRAFDSPQLLGYSIFGMMNNFTIYLTEQPLSILESSIPVYEKIRASEEGYGLVFFKKHMTYLLSYCDKKKEGLEVKLEEYEKSKDAVYADQTRKELKLLEEIRKQFLALESGI
jgi:aminopeptidase N